MQAIQPLDNFAIVGICNPVGEIPPAPVITWQGLGNQKEISKRLAQADKPLPAGLKVINLANDGPLSQTITRGAALLQPVSL